MSSTNNSTTKMVWPWSNITQYACKSTQCVHSLESTWKHYLPCEIICTQQSETKLLMCIVEKLKKETTGVGSIIAREPYKKLIIKLQILHCLPQSTCKFLKFFTQKIYSLNNNGKTFTEINFFRNRIQWTILTTKYHIPSSSSHQFSYD